MTTMGGCEVVKEVSMPGGRRPKALDDEFCWELPAKPGTWFVLKHPIEEGIIDQRRTRM